MTPKVPETLFPESVSPGVLAIQEFLKAQPRYRLENWKSIVASADANKLKCIRVTEEIERHPETKEIVGVHSVANITSARILVRTEAPGVPAGFYLVSENITRCPPRSHWSGYPDVSSAEPDLHELRTLRPVGISRDVLGSLCTFVGEILKYDGVVAIESDRAYMVQRPDTPFMFPFGLQEGCVVHPLPLSQALKEAHAYEQIFFGRQRSHERNMPLFFGFANNWRNCILVSTQTAHKYGGAPADML